MSEVLEIQASHRALAEPLVWIKTGRIEQVVVHEPYLDITDLPEAIRLIEAQHRDRAHIAVEDPPQE